MTTQVAVGFALGFIGLWAVTAAWWSEARRNDRLEAAVEALSDHLGVRIRYADDPGEPVSEDTAPMPLVDATPAVLARRDAAWDAAAAALTVRREIGGHAFTFRTEEP